MIVWQVNEPAQTVDRLVLPTRSHFPSYEAVQTFGQAPLSPDGEVVAIPVARSRRASPFLTDSDNYQETKSAIVQLHPLRLLNILQVGQKGDDLLGYAVDHRHGQTTVLIYRGGHWERTD